MAYCIDKELYKAIDYLREQVRVLLEVQEKQDNLVFLDGSVGAVPLRALWKLKWHKNFDINGYWPTSSAPWPEWMLKFGDEY